MKKNASRSRPSSDLRARAEKRLARCTPEARTDAETAKLLHELEVHRVELELQNEELRNARLEVETALASYTQIFDFAPIGYVVLTGDGVIAQLNLEAARLLGKPRAKLVGQRFERYAPVAEREVFRDLLAATLRASHDEAARTCEISLARDGDVRDVKVTAAPQGSPPEAALLAMEDITERRRAERALRDEYRRKDDFLAALSHELRNPLTPIVNALYLLERAEPGGAPADRAREIIERQVGHLTRIVDDLLDVTRIARGKLELHLRRCDLEKLVRQTIDDHRPAFERNGVALTSSLPSDPVWADVDPTRIAQALGNVLANAAKFTSRGGHVDVSIARNGERATIAVCDDGAGIDPELQARLFEPFSQAPQTLARSAGGLGLGLAVVKGILELHRGKVAVESAGPGRGSTFTLTLPLASAPQPVRPSQRAHATRGVRVLLIEDHAETAESLRSVLELDGHEVHVAHDGPSGLLKASSIRPNVVLCDIGLPGMNGYTVARALRNDQALQHTRLVALTGYGTCDDVQRAKEAGFDEHVLKPPTIEAIQSALANVAEAAGWREQR